MSQFLNLIKSVADGNNLSLLSSLTEPIQQQIKDSVGGNLENLKNAGQNVVESVENTITQKAPVLSDSLNSISKTYRWRNIIIVIVLLWAIFMILSRIFIKNEEVKKQIEDSHSLLFGQTGILMTIMYVWIGAIIIVTLVPAVMAITPKLENVLGSVNNVISAVSGGLLDGLKK